MMNEYIFEGVIVCTKGTADKGSHVSVIRRIDASCFKEELVVVGEKGFRGYPSEETYAILIDWMLKKYSIEGEILEIKKEGIYYAFFRAYK